MTVQKPCLTCGRLTRNGSYCERHEPISWKERPSPSSLLGRRPDLRAQVRERERGQCVACGYHGDTGNPLECHHVLDVATFGASANQAAAMQLLCRD